MLIHPIETKKRNAIKEVLKNRIKSRIRNIFSAMYIFTYREFAGASVVCIWSKEVTTFSFGLQDINK